jgi:hypothetical protein
MSHTAEGINTPATDRFHCLCWRSTATLSLAIAGQASHTSLWCLIRCSRVAAPGRQHHTRVGTWGDHALISRLLNASARTCF